MKGPTICEMLGTVLTGYLLSLAVAAVFTCLYLAIQAI